MKMKRQNNIVNKNSSEKVSYHDKSHRYSVEDKDDEQLNESQWRKQETSMEHHDLKREINKIRQKQNSFSSINNKYEQMSNNMIKPQQSSHLQQQSVDYSKKIDKIRKYAYIKSRQAQQLNNDEQQGSQMNRNIDRNSMTKYSIDSQFINSQSNNTINKKYPSLTKSNSINHTQYQPQYQQSNSKSKYYQQNQHNHQIQQFQMLLQQEKSRFKSFQQQTINNQVKVLQTINNLQIKLKQLHQQNISLKSQNTQLKSSKSQLNTKYHQNTEIQQLKQILQQKQTQIQQLTKQHKKIKGIGKGLLQIMKKVDLIEPPPEQDQMKFAWRWIKKVVWEYEGIRKKALSWKIAYEELNQDSITSQES